MAALYYREYSLFSQILLEKVYIHHFKCLSIYSNNKLKMKQAKQRQPPIAKSKHQHSLSHSYTYSLQPFTPTRFRRNPRLRRSHIKVPFYFTIIFYITYFGYVKFRLIKFFANSKNYFGPENRNMQYFPSLRQSLNLLWRCELGGANYTRSMASRIACVNKPC